MRQIFYILLASSIGLAAIGCGGSTSTGETARGHDPWVFRSVLDWRPRMITLALKDDFWVAYDASNASLYKVWRDGVAFDGPVYTTAHGPQPVSLGEFAYLVNPYTTPWSIRHNDEVTSPAVRYEGHRFRQGHAILAYELVVPDTDARIVITERPEVIRDAGGRLGFERVFTTSNVPDGVEVALATHLHSLLADSSYSTTGRFDAGPVSRMTSNGKTASTVDGTLTLRSNDETVFTIWIHDLPSVPMEAPRPDDEDKHPGLALIEKSDCHACHNTNVKTVGPSYVAVAERYETTPSTIEDLTTKIIRGGAGVWTDEVGAAIMTPHASLSRADARSMVDYILALDGEPANDAPNGDLLTGTGDVVPLFESTPGDPGQGIAVNVYRFAEPINTFPQIDSDELPVFSGALPALHARHDDFGDMQGSFYLDAVGELVASRTGEHAFRLVSDDGSRLFIDGRLVIDNGGLHGMEAVDATLPLPSGNHEIRVEFFQATGGRGLSLQWRPPGESEFSAIGGDALRYRDVDIKQTGPFTPPEPRLIGIPGDGKPVMDVHPGFRVQTIRPDDFEPMVGGMGFLSDGRMVVSTWDPAGSVYIVGNLNAEDRNDITVKRIAKGLAEPLGLTVVDDQIYVLQKQELTRLVDHDGDEVTDEYETVSNGWGTTTNFHEFAFGLVHRDGFFYATLATAILPGGASAQPQNGDRGKVAKISARDGSIEFIAHGLRTPNGIGIGVDNEMFVTDNQGDWLPSSKVVHLREGAFYGNRAVDPEGTSGLQAAPPVVWLPQDEIGNSPSQPARLDAGPYAGQMVHGEVTHGGLKRVFAELVDGEYQGAVFRFTQGLEAGVNRVINGPDGAIYVGGIGNPGNWGQQGKQWYGLQRLTYTGAPAFEMLAVRARTGGMEIEFTEPLRGNDGFESDDYLVKQWWYEPTENYGGPKMDEAVIPIRSVTVSADRKKVFLDIPGIEDGHVVYIRLKGNFISEPGNPLWTTEAWYTLNRIPRGLDGPTFGATASYQKVGHNQLTDAERKAGWRLLFDGKTIDHWRGYGQDTLPPSWQIEQEALAYVPRPDSKDDIITKDEFQNFELALEWKISPAGNSGIFYNVVESPEYDEAWRTGPEMQILDNDRHPDGKIRVHRAGDLYDLIESRFEAAKPVGEWNKVRIVIRDGKVEHWLNGQKVVAYELWTKEWNDLVAGSKFADVEGFGSGRKGAIALQDHDDRVWFRNIKIREL